jgi:hypothetical protein
MDVGEYGSDLELAIVAKPFERNSKMMAREKIIRLIEWII